MWTRKNFARDDKGNLTERVTSYDLIETVEVSSTDADRIADVSRKITTLIEQGVMLESQAPSYLYTKLNELKPQMIAEATAEARKGAEQFAHDSKSRIGGIRSANQGVFVILPRDEIPGSGEANQADKIVRVVATVEYRLVD